MEWFIYIAGMLLLGTGVGLMSAALGLGGGILMVPAFLAFVPGMDAHTAKGTSLFIIIFVAGLNAWRIAGKWPERPWRLVFLLAGGSIVGSLFGSWLTDQLPAEAVLWAFLTLIALVALRSFFLTDRYVSEAEVKKRSILSVLIGFVAGLAGGATGTGGGAVMIPLALMAGISGNRRVVGLSNMVMAATALAGTFIHIQAPTIYEGAYTYGHVCFGLAPLVFIGAQAGSYPGAWLNAHMSLRVRRTVMGILLLVISARILAGLL